jgi:hypothetical protein
MDKLSISDAVAEQIAFLRYSARRFDMLAVEAENSKQAEKLLLFSRILRHVALAADGFTGGQP